MSHDRGCFKCGADRWDYKACPHKDCPKSPEAEARMEKSSKTWIEKRQKMEEDQRKKAMG